MKTIKLLIILLFCFAATGCKEYGEKRIVNFITADKDKISVYYYDFTKEEPSYIKVEKENTGIKKTLVDILSQADYDLKLCRYAVVSSELIENNINELFFSLTDSRFAPDIVILEGQTGLEPEEYEETNKNAYPIYSYSINNNLLSGVVDKLEGNQKYIVINNKIYKQLNEQQSFVFDILSKTKKQGIYSFENDNDLLSAEMEKTDTYCFLKDDTLYLNCTAVLKSYKGMPAGEEYKTIFTELLEQNLRQNIEELLQDDTITEKFNLLWYKKVRNFEKVIINVDIR